MENPANILHLIKDEKITDQVIENFNQADDGNMFLILSEEGFKFTKNRGENIILFDWRKEDVNEIVERFSIKAILAHALFPPQVETLLKIKKKLPIGWFVWGFDVYGLPKIQPGTYAPKTKTFLLKSKKDLRFAWWIRKRPGLRKFYYRKIAKSQDKVSELEAAIAKVDYFISYIREDFEVFSRHYPNKLGFLHCGFSTIDQYLAGDKSTRIDGDAKNILVGNSSSPENNQLDVFPTLKKAPNEGAKIVVPLSYGYHEAHKNKVLEVGKKELGEAFAPLTGFMDRKAYLGVLKSCSAAVFYHFRQQAMGNIIALLHIGARVYLSRKNPLFSYFGRLGVKVFDFDKEFSMYGNQKLNPETARQNREVLEKLFSGEKVIREMTEVSGVLRQDSK